MTDRPRKFDGEDRQTEDLAPENQNAEQDDSGEQAQTVADESLGRSAAEFGLEDSEKVSTGEDSDEDKRYAGEQQAWHPRHGHHPFVSAPACRSQTGRNSPAFLRAFCSPS